MSSRSLIILVCIVGCLATGMVWEIILQGKSSSKSRMYVLHDWKTGSAGVYSDDTKVPFPVYQTSDIILKTMGILREGVNWPGVNLGNLFSRPLASALFIIDGISDDVNVPPLSDRSYYVDQTGLTGQTSDDIQLMFEGDNILKHFHRLFNGQSLTLSVSGDEQAFSLVNSPTNILLNEKPSIEEMTNLIEKDLFDFSCQVDSEFVSELITISTSVKKLSQSAVTDNKPDIYVFSFSTLRALETKYGVHSDQMKVAMKLVHETILQVKDELVEAYNGNIVIQSLVLQWKYISLTDEQIETIRYIFQYHYFTEDEIQTVLKQLPSISLPKMDTALCESLAYFLEGEDLYLQAECTRGSNSRLRREVFDDSQYSNKTVYSTPGGLVEERSENFPAIFLICFVTVVPLILALFAISWAMWNMDPGEDSVIYRNTDHVTTGVKLE